jgi:hypothetical protein
MDSATRRNRESRETTDIRNASLVPTSLNVSPRLYNTSSQNRARRRRIRFRIGSARFERDQSAVATHPASGTQHVSVPNVFSRARDLKERTTVPPERAEKISRFVVQHCYVGRLALDMNATSTRRDRLG